jgi:hypothetical protein
MSGWLKFSVWARFSNVFSWAKPLLNCILAENPPDSSNSGFWLHEKTMLQKLIDTSLHIDVILALAAHLSFSLTQT